LYRAMKARGKTVDEVMRICIEAADDFFAGFPPAVLRLAGKLADGRLARNAMKNQADRSKARRHPEDFVYEVREGGGDDLVLEFTECAVNKLYEAQQVEELKPFCNFFDVVYSRRMGLGLDAHETIGQGCNVCRLRYKRGRETRVPERLVSLLPPVQGDGKGSA
ncbi:MAG: L-2-amino-thiazoline-4-carboxylic acid hydrolase, partial [Deltaproteobacteria bacterium]|nr:L-2-amino-thiazoline-4-carboxylic acid hydrolase [Deltaproteobacteria bacterium]